MPGRCCRRSPRKRRRALPAEPRVVLRHGLAVEDPLAVALGFLEAYRLHDLGEPDQPDRFDEPDLRLANRGGARIAATEIAAILERREAIERALRSIPAGASLTAAVPGAALRELFDAFAGIRGVGFAKATKALHPKRRALIPILDSVVAAYLAEDDPGPERPFGERALALVGGYRRDLRDNLEALRALRQAVAARGHELTEVRLLDVLIWSVFS